MKLWRRTVRCPFLSPPVLLSARFNVVLRTLAMAFDRWVTVTGAFGATGLICFSGTAKYAWQSTLVGSGYLVTTQHQVGIGDPHLLGLYYGTTPPVVIDRWGVLWPLGDYELTLS